MDVAANGKEAVEMVQTFPYDMVFMDCQMPEMDGYEATAEIRRGENGTKHIPIIAMTAHAMQGDRERCLDAGMDDYVSKPVSTENLTEIMRQYPPSTTRHEESVIIDRAVFSNLWKILGEDTPELTRSFLDETDQLLTEMRRALDLGDWDSLDKAAHTLKGSSATIGANGLSKICQQLQALSDSDSYDQATEKFTELRKGFDRVKSELTELLI